MRQRCSRILAMVAVFWSLSLTWTPTSSAADAPEKVTLSFPSLTLSVAPLWIAKDAGIFASEGLNAELAFIRGSGTAVQALVGGNTHAGYAGAPPVAAAISSGAKIVVVGVPVNRMDYVLVSRHTVKDPAELRGKRFAIGRIGDSNEIATRVALERLKIDPGSVKLMAIGGSPDRIAALRSGAVDGAILSATEYLGSSSEFHLLYDLAQAGIEYPFDTIFVTRRYLAEKRKTVLSIVRSFVRAVRFIRTNKQESLNISARWLRNPDPRMLEQQWKHVAFNLYQENPYPTETGFRLAFKGMAQINPKVAELRMADVVDTSVVDELERSGFLKSK